MRNSRWSTVRGFFFIEFSKLIVHFYRKKDNKCAHNYWIVIVIDLLALNIFLILSHFIKKWAIERIKGNINKLCRLFIWNPKIYKAMVRGCFVFLKSFSETSINAKKQYCNLVIFLIISINLIVIIKLQLRPVVHIFVRKKDS